MSDEKWQTAQRRHALYYQRVLARADDLYLQGDDGIATGLELFDLEWANIEAGHGWATSQWEHDEAAARLCIAYPNRGAYILGLRQHPTEFIRWQETALSAAQFLKDRRSEGKALGNLGNAYRNLGEVRKSFGYYEQALRISREVGDRQGEGVRLGNLGIAYSDLGEVKKAIEHYEQALVISREIGDRRGESINLGNMGRAYSALGEASKAIELMEASLKILEEIESPNANIVRQWLERLRSQ